MEGSSVTMMGRENKAMREGPNGRFILEDLATAKWQ